MTPYQSLLVDPCKSLPVSPYGGERGIVERFVSDITFGTATHTCGVAVLQPCTNAFGGFTQTASNVTTLGTSGTAVADGFFAANVQKARPIAACIELIPSSLSITNITGELAMGVLDSLAVGGGVNTTVDATFVLLNDREVLQKRDYEVKWYPGAADNLYNARSNNGGLLTAAEPSSQNEVLIAWRGVPPGTVLSFRLTIVYEWTPFRGLGLAATTAPGMTQDWQNQSAALHIQNPGWWTNKHGPSFGRPGFKQGIDRGNKLTKSLYAALTDYPQLADMAMHALDQV